MPHGTRMFITVCILPIHLSQSEAKCSGIWCIWIGWSICMPPAIFVSSDGRTEKKTPIEHIHYILQPSIWYTDMRPMVSDHNKALANQYSLSNQNSCLNDPKTSRWAPTNYKWDYKVKLSPRLPIYKAIYWGGPITPFRYNW